MKRLLLTTAALLAFAAAPAAAGDEPAERVRQAIAASVRAHLGGASGIAVDILQAPSELATSGGAMAATATTGARLGQPTRFLLAPESGRPFTVLARVTATVGHAVATHPLGRDVPMTAADVEWRHGTIDGELLQAPPSLEEVLSARTRRSIGAGEVINRAAIVRPFAVRAGDTVSLTVREGGIEVRGVGRAVSSGFIGDVIRIMPPNSRQPSRARIVGPAAVEMVR